VPFFPGDDGARSVLHGAFASLDGPSVAGVVRLFLCWLGLCWWGGSGAGGEGRWRVSVRVGVGGVLNGRSLLTGASEVSCVSAEGEVGGPSALEVCQ
jgi:hypothetical protein